MKQPNLRRTRRSLPAVMVLGLASTVALAGCGSSTSAAGGSGAAAGPGFEQAKSLAQTYGKAPTSIGITEPVGKPVPSAKTIVIIGAGTASEGTILMNHGFKSAAEVLGWTIKEIDPQQPTPQLVQQALDQAIRLHPDAVAISAVDQAPIATQLKQLQSMNIPVIETFSPDPAGGPITMQLMDAQAQARLTKAVADKTLADMGKPGEIGMVGLAGYAVVQAYSKGFSGEVGKLCPTCQVKTTQVPIESLGTTAGTDIVNFVRSNPQMKALFVGYDGMDSNLFSAAKSVGVKLPPVYSSATLPTSLASLADGELTASAPIDYDELG
ncbi:MAG: hypothetical protein JWP74_962, partial [Marmoricola sp.]|nr:hypothetical protein [Marmoricola sp.]